MGFNGSNVLDTKFKLFRSPYSHLVAPATMVILLLRQSLHQLLGNTNKLKLPRGVKVMKH